jgi:GNAT superfamily N-acetyltransferase
MDFSRQHNLNLFDENHSARKKAEENAQKFSILLTSYLSKEFYNSRKIANSVTGHTVNALGDGYELYLRITPPPGGIWDADTLVIARIGFKAHRRGHGRKFINFLVECASILGYRKIGLECTNERSNAFGKKFGLQEHGAQNHLLGTVHEVARTLDKYFFEAEQPSCQQEKNSQ